MTSSVTIHLPHDLESSIQAAVHAGRFATVEDAMAEAARLLLREISQGQPDTTGTGSIGAMREADDELDEIEADAMTRRREEPPRVIPAPGNGWRCVSYSGKKEFIVTRNDLAGFVR
jgi:Arc/MetJ-type ribon-helix-helix transcriptional regulator